MKQHRNILIQFITLAFYLFSTLSIFAQQKSLNQTLKFPAATNYANDFENILTTEQENTLNQLISNIEKETLLEFAVATIPPSYLGVMDINLYSLELAKSWGIGKKELNNGILIAISKEKRLIRIQVGTGIEKIYSNNQISRVIQETIVPSFKQGGFYEGIYASIIRMTEELRANLKKL